MVLDTDTYNEIDDQFALVYAMLSPDQLDVEAIYAAPFHNERSDGPGDGMAKSYEEIQRLLDRLGRSLDGFVHRGSQAWLPDDRTPVPSDAADDLVERAMSRQPGDAPLYIAAIGAITNIASALLIEPAIAERIVIIWLSGHPYDWPTAKKFNLKQDLHASRLLFDCGVPLVHVPCKNVAEHVRTTLAELRQFVAPCGRISQYLFDIYSAYCDDHFAYAKEIWDVVPIAWLVEPKWVPTLTTGSPLIADDMTWHRERGRHSVRVAVDADRNAIFRDFFSKLSQCS